MCREIGFGLDNATGHDASVILADKLLPQEFLRHGHGVTIEKRAREHIPSGHNPSIVVRAKECSWVTVASHPVAYTHCSQGLSEQ
jgi:hypothetical protein